MIKQRICAAALALGLLVTTSVPAFAATTTETSAMQAIRALGIMTGDSNGNLQLDRTVTRAEFTKMLTEASTYRDSIGQNGSGYSLFKDVKSTYWASEYIKTALDAKWVTGYTDGTFRPENPITLEEACTAALRLLGYDTATLSGSFPTAQLSKASSLGLRDHISVAQGGLMTRRDCMYLFYDLMTADNSEGKVYATTLGYTLNTAGELDYTALIAKDLKGPYTADNGNVSLPFSTPTEVYRDGVLSTLAAVQPYDVYYYNTTLKTVYVYIDQVTGTYTSATPSAASPTSVTVAGQTYEIESADAEYKLSTAGQFATGDVVTLLLGMDGKVADAVSPNLVTAEDTNMAAIVSDGLEGPYTVTANGMEKLPFAASEAKIYKDGKPSDLSEVAQYNVYYYNSSLKMIYVYDERVTGAYAAATPGEASPTSVTVSGKDYTIESSQAAYQLSSLGAFSVGDVVTLLLGMDGKVADVVSAEVLSADDANMVEAVAEGLKGPYIVGQTGMELPFALTEAQIYKNGEASSLSDVSTYDVYYYNSNLKLVYVYDERETGTYTAAKPGVASPTSVTVGGTDYDIESNQAAYQLSSLGPFAIGDVVTLLLGRDNTIAGVVSAAELSADELDSLEIVSGGLEGPYTVAANYSTSGTSSSTSNGMEKLPFALEDATVYKNGKASSASAVEPYDIYYYNETLKLVYLYDERASGTYTSATPNITAPESVVVGGNTYQLGSADARYKLSSLGGSALGDSVTLLFGKDGTVVDVITGQSVQAVYYGVVQATDRVVDDVKLRDTTLKTEVQVACTDGTVRSFHTNVDDSFTVGRLVEVTISGGTTSIKHVGNKTLTGKVNSAATRLGNLTLADDLEIIDVGSDGTFVPINRNRLAGCTLTSSEVGYYSLNTDGEIDRLILNDATGDTWHYGYLMFATEKSDGETLTVQYTYVMDGETKTIKPETAYGVKGGNGLAVRYDTDGAIKTFKTIASTRLTGLTSLTAQAENKTYKLADAVQVYLRREGVYYPATLSDVINGGYTLVGYYDNFGCSAGGRIRVIIAYPDTTS